MFDLRGWARGGVRLTTLALLALLNAGCPNRESTTSTGTGASGGDGGQGGTGATGGGGSGGAGCEPEQEICDQKDNDCNGQVDDVPGLQQACACDDGTMQECYTGDPETDGVGTCKKGQQACAGGTWGECLGQVTPATEQCNLEDDDCDGTVDDMGQASCGVGECAAVVEKCVGGALQTCAPIPPAEEVCDGKDNDCDGKTDEADPMLGQSCTGADPGVCAEGKLACAAGALTCVGGVPKMELCDGLDNDCDGTVDDVAGAGAMCSTSLLGVCAAGAVDCQLAGGSYLVDCYPIVPPSPEVCDDLDNDCDGDTDEDDPEGGAACDTGQLGACQAGILHCVDGSVTCVPSSSFQPEQCNGEDDDCDGMIDDGDPGGGLGCFTGLDGVCGDGTTSCTDGAIACNQTEMASPEVCDDLDNDCNGLVDDGNPGGGAACSTGLLGVCEPGTMTCTGGQLDCEQDVQASAEVCGNAIDENCDGVAVANVTVYFDEPFANNDAGWTLGSTWQIGQAVSSGATGSCGGGDPAQDHTATADNGVAGAVLGGNVTQSVAGPYYLTSPIIDTSAAPSLYLEYWRWLHSDYPPYMVDLVQVYDGSTWITVWNNPGSVVNDTQWVKMSHDVSAHKNANFQIRFSYQVSSGAYLCAGWNVDDVQLVNAPCN